MFPAIIFDLDGTLIDSVPDVRIALNTLLKEKKRREVTLDEAKELVGEGARVLIEKGFAMTGNPVAEDEIGGFLARYLAFYKQHPADYTVIYPGVLQVLQSLKDQGLKLGICTNKPMEMTEIVLKIMGLDVYFAGVCGDHPSLPKKPDPAMIKETLRRMGAENLPAIMIGDSITDIKAARNANIPVIAVAYGYAKIPPEQLGGDILIEEFAQLPAALKELWGKHA